MGRATRLFAVYTVAQEPLWGWYAGEKVSFRPRRVRIEVVAGESETISIHGPQVEWTRQPWAMVEFGGSYAPLHEAPVWALEMLAETKNMLNGA